MQLPDLPQEGRMRNAPVGVSAPRKGWILYADSPNSSLAARDRRDIATLARALPPDWAFLVIAKVEDEPLDVSVPVLTRLPENDLAKYRLPQSPRTYVLDRDWKLLEVLDGPYEGEVAKRLERRLDRQLRPSADGIARIDRRQNQPDRFRNLCLDMQQRPYSPGAKVEALGLTLECGPGGLWAPLV